MKLVKFKKHILKKIVLVLFIVLVLKTILILMKYTQDFIGDISGLSALNRALDKNCIDMGGINVDTSTFFMKKTTCYIGKSNGLLSVDK